MDNLANILDGLNPQQKEAVEAINGPLLILAGPGSGKTMVITRRIAYLLKTVGVSPRHIMAVTFTNKAAKEMSKRLFGESEHDPIAPLLNWSLKGQVSLGTFHAIGARILRQHGRAAGIDPHFVIYDDDDQTGLVKRALVEAGFDPKQYAPASVCAAISAAKSQLLSPADYAAHTRSYFDEVVGRVYERYQGLLAQSNALDFDDLLMRVVLLFRAAPDILTQYQGRYVHLLVDEFQDTNLVQYEIMKLMAAKYRNLCVVGDPDQSIYSWRSADIRNILNFEKDYPDAKVILLEQNYRSTQTILAAAAKVIAANRQRKQKGLWTENEDGEPVRVVETFTEGEEAQFVVSEIDRLVRREGCRMKDIAVMYRTNAQSRVLEEAFVRHGMPYKLVAGTRFYERREVKDLLGYMRLLLNPDDSVSLLRVINVPGRGIGQRTTAELTTLAKSLGISAYRALATIAGEGGEARSPFSPRTVQALAGFYKIIEELITLSHEEDIVSLLDKAVERTGFQAYLKALPDGEERWENVLELREVAREHQVLPPREALAAFLERAALVSDVDSLDESKEGAVLITLHQAKGLEFPVVFIVGTEDGILPHIRSFDDPAQMEEERRLFYVGMTRAKRKLYLVRAFRRSLMGASTARLPSRFLKDIPPHLLSGDAVWRGEESPVGRVYEWERGGEAAPRPRTPPLELKAGDRVRHPKFGEGVVVTTQPVKDDIEVTVAFGGVGVKKLALSFANLEKVGA